LTLYRINPFREKEVEVLMGWGWKALEGSEEEILVRELNPQPLGSDSSYRYVVTDEPQ
jgi:hypothetical protein